MDTVFSAWNVDPDISHVKKTHHVVGAVAQPVALLVNVYVNGVGVCKSSRPVSVYISVIKHESQYCTIQSPLGAISMDNRQKKDMGK